MDINISINILNNILLADRVVETEVGELCLAKLREVFVHLNDAEVGVHDGELGLEVFGVERISTFWNEWRINFSCSQSLPVDGIKEGMTLDILANQSLLWGFYKQLTNKILIKTYVKRMFSDYNPLTPLQLGIYHCS